MYLAPAFRVRGLSRKLLDRAQSWAQAQPLSEVVLDTAEAMVGAQRLHESAGFERTGSRSETGAHDSRCEVLYRLRL